MRSVKLNGSTGHRTHVIITATGKSSISNIRVGIPTHASPDRDQGINYVFMAIFFPIILVLLSALAHKYFLKENTHMFFKTNPKQLVVNKATNLFGRASKVKVEGRRPIASDCKAIGIPVGAYFVTCTINGTDRVVAAHRDWRKAYGLLVIEVEKLFTAKLNQITSE